MTRDSFKDIFTANPTELAQRYPAYFRLNWRNRAAVVLSVTAMIGLAVFALFSLGVDWQRVVSGLQRLWWFVSVMLPPDYGTPETLWVYVNALFETMAMAILGTVLAAALALPLSFLAARTVIPNFFIRFTTRRTLDVIRTVNILIWALIWINVVGLGPFAGVLALAIADIGIMGKIFYEAIEAVDQKASLGVVSTGAGPGSRIRFGLIPGVLPVLTGQVLYEFEANIRGASILGVVGAGGIGAFMQEQIRLNEWQHVAFLTLLLLITVIVIDFVSSRIRFAVIGTHSAAAEEPA